MKNLEKLNVQEMFQGKRKDDASHPKQIKTCFFFTKKCCHGLQTIIENGSFHYFKDVRQYRASESHYIIFSGVLEYKFPGFDTVSFFLFELHWNINYIHKTLPNTRLY